MGKITNALKRAAEDRLNRIDKITRVKEREQLVVKKIGESKIDPSIVTYFDQKALISEQYKILRTNILSINKTKPIKSLVITSSLHSEGKTVTALNLAFSLAQAVHKPKVLLVDADMRRGRVGRYLGVPPRAGLSEFLAGECSQEEVCFHLDYDNLTFIAAGTVPENPAELLASERMRNLLLSMRSQFDHVLIDTPPIIPVTDSGILGSQTDGILMIIQAGRTQRGIIRRAEELISQTQSKIVGHVLTNIEYHLPEYIYRYL